MLTSIGLADGTRLAATLYLPERLPAPCLLEALPYRKDDVTYGYRTEYETLAAEHGYAVCRVDVRGTGSSQGVPEDEYPATEVADLCEVIAWLAAQEWCDGGVGMYGTSYSGFNALCVAAARPPALRAICSIYASDDRYTDDVHYAGGIHRWLDIVDYPAYMAAMNALPPVPEVYGEGWREEWLRRLDATEPWLLRWMAERHDGAYWRQGSLRQDGPGAGQGSLGGDEAKGRQGSLRPGAAAAAQVPLGRGEAGAGKGFLGPNHGRIAVPTMLVAGWADGYANVVPRLSAVLERDDVPYRVIAGPWSHASPDHALPGPGIELLPEMVRWWDRWLRGDCDAAPDRSAVVFVRSSTPPAPDRAMVNGEFRDLPAWPSLPEHPFSLATPLPEHPSSLTTPLPESHRSPRAGSHSTEGSAELLDAWAELPTAPDIGVAVWNNCAGSLPWGQALDQRTDDARCVIVEWESPAEGLTIVGHPRLRARVRTGAGGTLAARLCDVAPDGASELVSRGVLRLPGVPEPQVESGSEPEAKVVLRPVVECEAELELDVVAHRVVPGHRLRLALATSEWPNVMASPEAVPVAVDLGGSALLLPLAGGPLGEPATGLRRTEAPVPDATDVVWTIDHDVLQRVTRCVTGYGSAAEPLGGGTYADRYEGQVTLDHRTRHQTAVAGSDFTIAWQGGPVVTTRSRVEVVAWVGELVITVDLTAIQDGIQIMSRSWTCRVEVGG
ncbi:CocE/NonD family hydrolase [Sphaerisporangium viridialbum]|uniref:CocE/NonD family hydrolase n=1 Tax=Sphaerisporangium viridialbum TaxID=46189 RepID=UPI003C777EC5